MPEVIDRVAKRLYALDPEGKGNWRDAPEADKKKYQQYAWEALDEIRIPSEPMIEAGCSAERIPALGPQVMAVFNAMMKKAMD